MFLYTKKVATVAIVVLMTIALCSTTIEEVRTQFLRNKVIASSYATKQPISQLHCIEWCSRERQVGKCRIAGYHKSSKTCKLSMDYPYTLLNVADEASGVFLIETGEILLSSPSKMFKSCLVPSSFSLLFFINKKCTNLN